MKTKEQKQVIEQAKKIASKVNIKTTNEILTKLGDEDFKISKRVLENIAEWCLNGDTDDEIRKKIDLSKSQWGILLAVCPTVIATSSRYNVEQLLSTVFEKCPLGKVCLHGANSELG